MTLLTTKPSRDEEEGAVVFEHGHNLPYLKRTISQKKVCYLNDDVDGELIEY